MVLNSCVNKLLRVFTDITIFPSDFRISTQHFYAQGTNARKVISEVYAYFVQQCTVFGRKCKHKTDFTTWHGTNFHKNNLWNILVIGKYYANFQNYQNSMLLTSSDTRRTWCIYSCLQIQPKENWFQHVRRVYTTAINFPCISTLSMPKYIWFRFVLKKNILRVLTNITSFPSDFRTSTQHFHASSQKRITQVTELT